MNCHLDRRRSAAETKRRDLHLGLPIPFAALALLALTAPAPAPAPAQTVMGTLSTHDAQVNGGMSVQGERAQLLSNDAITAFDHSAPITLTRGGEVLVCSTSQFHLVRTGAANALLFGLDRGALELHGPADAHDILITPDIRFSLEDAGTPQAPKQYDLSLRVTTNGDTCVQNAGASAPVLILADPFSSTTYRLIPGQHVLFEHGNLHQVVDNERSNCGCPAETPAAALTPAEQAHPFPAAQSAGLVPITPIGNSTPDGVTHTQIDANLSYNAGQPRPAAEPTTPSTVNPAAATVSTTPPPAPPGAHDIAHAIRHFFHKLFHPNEKPAEKPAS